MHFRVSIFVIFSFFCFSSGFLFTSQRHGEKDLPTIKDLIRRKQELYEEAKIERDARKKDSGQPEQNLGLNTFGTNLVGTNLVENEDR